MPARARAEWLDAIRRRSSAPAHLDSLRPPASAQRDRVPAIAVC
jgi:hypothetical protein